MTNLASSRSAIGSTSLANSGKNSILLVLSSLSTSNLYQNSWILDSGATDHMTPVVDQFLSYELCIIGQNVQTADGNLLKVAGIGGLHIELIGLLSTVLHVPKFFVSLMSV